MKTLAVIFCVLGKFSIEDKRIVKTRQKAGTTEQMTGSEAVMFLTSVAAMPSGEISAKQKMKLPLWIKRLLRI